MRVKRLECAIFSAYHTHGYVLDEFVYVCFQAGD